MKTQNESPEETLSLSAAALSRDVHEDLERYKRWLHELLAKLTTSRLPTQASTFSAPAGQSASQEATS